MRRSSRLVTGTAALTLLVLLCVVGPALRSAPPPGDPSRAALLPPGATATAVVLDSGRTLVSPRVTVTEDVVVVGGIRRDTEVPRERVVAVRQVRFWLGSDRFGRDVLQQIMTGGRISLSVAFLGALIALLAGSTVGLAAATGGRMLDAVLMRIVDAVLAFPVLFLLILVAALVRPGPALLVVVLGLTSWMGLARLVRGQVLSLRGRTFVLAARAAGCPPTRIWRTHYLPNLSGPMSQDTALRLGDLVIAEATLSYLGLGIPPGMPTWGSMVAQGHRVMVDGWWLATFPGLAIAALVIALALIGDGIQERLSRS